MADDKNKENEFIDLSGMLKDSGVKFQDERQRPAEVFYPGIPKIVQWVIKYSGGLIKNEKQAYYVILGFVALAIIISLFLFFGGVEKSAKFEVPLLQNPPMP